MNSRLDEAIAEYTRNRTDSNFLKIYQAFVSETHLVPVSEEPKELVAGQYDVPVICVRTESGSGAIPVFTSLEHLLKWKPEGCLYVSLDGRTLLTMAIGMHDISEIEINPGDAPRGRIPRVDFEDMLSL